MQILGEKGKGKTNTKDLRQNCGALEKQQGWVQSEWYNKGKE